MAHSQNITFSDGMKIAIDMSRIGIKDGKPIILCSFAEEVRNLIEIGLDAKGIKVEE